MSDHKKDRRSSSRREHSSGGGGGGSRKLVVSYADNGAIRKKMVRLPGSMAELQEAVDRLSGKSKTRIFLEDGVTEIDDVEVLDDGTRVQLFAAAERDALEKETRNRSVTGGGGDSSDSTSTTTTTTTTMTAAITVSTDPRDWVEPTYECNGTMLLFGSFLADNEREYQLHREFLAKLGDGALPSKDAKAFMKALKGTELVEVLETPAPPEKVTKKLIGLACGGNWAAGLSENCKFYCVGAKKAHATFLGYSGAREDNPKIKLPDKAAHVVSGPFHTAAITKKGKLLTWGFNINCLTQGAKGAENQRRMMASPPQFQITNALGTAPDKQSNRPTFVRGFTGEALAVSCGGAHTLLISTDGVWSWGLNDEEQLGRGGSKPEQPALVDFFAQKRMVGVCAGGHHSFAWDDTGELYGWGFNSTGQLGVQVGKDTHVIAVPTLVPTSKLVRQVAAGTLHSVALTKEGHVLTWGSNAFGQLGRPTPKPKDAATPKEVAFPAEYGEQCIVRVAAMGDATLAVNDIGEVFVWGFLKGPNLLTHAKAPRMLSKLKRHFVMEAGLGMTHLATLCDTHLTSLLGELGQPSSAWNNTAIADRLAKMEAATIERLMRRLTKVVLEDTERREPLIAVAKHVLDFVIDGETALASSSVVLTSPAGKTANVTVKSIHTSDLPATVTLEIEPKDCVVRKGEESKIRIVAKSSEKVPVGPHTMLLVLNAERDKDVWQQLVVLRVLPVKASKKRRGGAGAAAASSAASLRSVSSVSGAASGRLDSIGGGGSIPNVVGGIAATSDRRATGSSPSIAAASSMSSVPAATTTTTTTTSSASEAKLGLGKSKAVKADVNFQAADVVLFEKLGGGGSGANVFRASADGFTCAVKVLDLKNSTEVTRQAFVHEIKILESLEHDNIVKYLGHDLQDNSVRLFMEFYPFSLQRILKKRKGVKLPSSDIKRVVLMVAKGVLYLHQQQPPIIHRDLKSGNVLCAMDATNAIVQAKITDFDISALSGDGDKQVAGTSAFIAPEVYEKKGATTASDVWSFGMLILEVLTLKQPYWQEEASEIPRLVKKGTKPLMPKNSPAELTPLEDIVGRCLHMTPKHRPTMEEIVKELTELA